MIIDIHLQIEALGIDDIYQFEITDFEVGYHSKMRIRIKLITVTLILIFTLLIFTIV